MLATRLNRLLTLTFSTSSGFKNILPQMLYLYKLGQDSHTQSVHCLLYHIYTAGILAVLCVQVCTSEPSGLCGLLTALQQP